MSNQFLTMPPSNLTDFEEDLKAVCEKYAWWVGAKALDSTKNRMAHRKARNEFEEAKNAFVIRYGSAFGPVIYNRDGRR